MLVNPNNSHNGGILTVDEAYKIIGIPKQTLLRLIAQGEINADKSARPMTLLSIDVDAMRDTVEKNRVKATSINYKRMEDRTFKTVRVQNGVCIPEGFDRIITYKELTQYTRAFAASKIRFMLLIGSPGAGKSQQMQHELGIHTKQPKAKWIEGYTRPLDLYCKVYEAQNRPVVLDDVLYMINDNVAKAILKAIGNTDKIKHCQWGSSTSILDERGIPKEYTTESQICFIANKWDDGNVDMAAISDRSGAGRVAFYPSANEVHNRVVELGFIRHKEVLSFVGDYLERFPQPSMRAYQMAQEWLEADFDWKKKWINVFGDVAAP